MTDTVLDRLLRYVVIDTQSDPESRTQPSTEKQKDLGRVLVDELLALGLDDAHMDEHSNVYATVPANTDKQVPVICFCSHMDTAPDFTGTNMSAADILRLHNLWLETGNPRFADQLRLLGIQPDARSLN